MRYILFILPCLIIFSCTDKPIQWEYKVVSLTAIDPMAHDGHEAFKDQVIAPTDSDLNRLGSEGWELVSATTEPETAWPNFGKADYVTGLQPNVRTGLYVMVFKRKKVQK